MTEGSPTGWFYESDVRRTPPLPDRSKPQFATLKFFLDAYGDRRNLYVLATKSVGIEVERQLWRLEGVLAVIPMGEYIDLLIAGEEDYVRAVGERIVDRTESPIGGIHYQKRTFSQSSIEQAYRDARRSGRKVNIAGERFGRYS